MTSKFLLALAFAAVVTPAFAADYQVNLGPMPLDDETKAVIAGRGNATASSDGKTLTVTARGTDAQERPVHDVAVYYK